MLDRFGPFNSRAVLAAAAAALAAAIAPAATAVPAAGAVAAPAAIGGAQLAGRGVIVNYPPGSVPRLPGVKASAFVIADADTGQVLAARDPHGWYRPASTLKVLTAISLIPALNPDATVVATKRATMVSPNVVGLLPGHPYKISDLFSALLTISANDAAVALTQADRLVRPGHGADQRGGQAPAGRRHRRGRSPTGSTPPASTRPPTTWP